jgi:hypothetical protein
LARDDLAAVAEAREDRRVRRHGIVEADLGEDAVLVRDHHAGLRDILEADILAPERVRIAAIDLDPDRRIVDRYIDQGQVDFMLADRGVALALEGGVDQRELPGGRGLLGQDSIAAAIKFQILAFVAAW